MDYPTAEVDLEMDGWAKKTKVALVPEVPVDVLIGIKALICQKKYQLIQTAHTILP